MPKQSRLTAFIPSCQENNKSSSSSSSSLLLLKKRKLVNGSNFGICPLCQTSLPLHRLEVHASNCDGTQRETSRRSDEFSIQLKNYSEPLPGLFLFEEFITEEEEQEIMAQLDGESDMHRHELLPWKACNFNGTHDGKRWGVHCNLRDRKVSAPENPLPHFVQHVLVEKLKKLPQMMGCVPNEANAIDYRRQKGHWLDAHVDDRQLSKEPIANLSIAGDCVMTFRNVAPNRNTAASVQRVLLKRRTLQILTGKARYDFSHGIAHEDLLSDRRVSVTMRESPLTDRERNLTMSAPCIKDDDLKVKWWWQDDKNQKSIAATAAINRIEPSVQPLPGLYVYFDFISVEEEEAIINELDCEQHLKWKTEHHTGHHREKRFGIDYDLWSRALRSPKTEMPAFMESIILPKLKRVESMQGCVPNDANAIDYRREKGDYLKAHVDDRKRHKEPIANLSLCGDCIMTYRNEARGRNLEVNEKKVRLPRRCLQVMTGKARYEFSHGIENRDLLSDRRVSLTMRETPWHAT